MTNQEIEQAELARWATKPDSQIAYFKFPADEGKPYRANFRPFCRTPDHQANVTLWTGLMIGTITHANVYRHNLGGRFVSIRVRGTNGAQYYGRASFDWGTAIKLHRAKAAHMARAAGIGTGPDEVAQ